MPAIRLRPRTVLVLFNLFAFIGAFILQYPSPFGAWIRRSDFALPVFFGCWIIVALLVAGFLNWFFSFFVVRANDFDAEEYGLMMKQLAIASGGLLIFLHVAESQVDPLWIIRYLSAIKAPAWIDLFLGACCCITLALLRRFAKRVAVEKDPSTDWGKQWTPNDDKGGSDEN